MSAKRYFQMAYLWPVVVPAVIGALAGVVVPDWIGEGCKGALRWGAIPAALFATGMLLWTVDKGSVSVRRSTYLAPLLFSPVLGAYLLISSGPQGTANQPGAQLFAWLMICGFLIVAWVVPVGYCYVGLINLAFV